MNNKILNINLFDLPLKNTISKELGISEILAQILINRGIKSIDEAEKFLNIKLEDLLDPFSFSDMHSAVRLIKKAVQDKEKVMVFGDYDVDGLTALTILKNTLSKIGLDTMHYVPHRVNEGYGLSKNILHLAKNNGIKLLITVDCGTNDHQQIKQLRSNNIEVIVTDHHESLSLELPPASAVINPKLRNSNYKYRDLAGVGVAYKLCQAIKGEALFDELDLVALGTISDIVPLTGENRIIVKEGLTRLSQSQRFGIKALIESSGLKEKKINSTFVSYILGPRINASGRINTAEVALSLLMSQEEAEAKSLAQIIETHNRQRQKIEGKILEEAQDLIAQEINFKEHKIIVIAKENWHPGVLGIVASKLADRFYRPVIVISKTDNLCKGSGRSIKNFHLFKALTECKDFLETFGGHSHAAGLVINKNSIDDFKYSINNFAKEVLALEDLLPSLDVDMELSLSDLNEKVITELEVLAPFGADNPEPLFYTRNLRLKGVPLVLSRNTLKFWVTDGSITYQAIGFGMGGLKDSLMNTEAFDLVYFPRMDNWQEEGVVLLEVKEIFFK